MIGLHRATALLHLLVTLAGLAAALAPARARAAAGDLYEADFSSNTILKFTADGATSTFASGLSGPYGLAFDSSGNLFQADYNSGTIFKFASDGTKSTFASGLNTPVGLAVDSSGSVYVADTSNNRIEVFAPTLVTMTASPTALSTSTCSAIHAARSAKARNTFPFREINSPRPSAMWASARKPSIFSS